MNKTIKITVLSIILNVMLLAACVFLWWQHKEPEFVYYEQACIIDINDTGLTTLYQFDYRNYSIANVAFDEDEIAVDNSGEKTKVNSLKRGTIIQFKAERILESYPAMYIGASDVVVLGYAGEEVIDMGVQQAKQSDKKIK